MPCPFSVRPTDGTSTSSITGLPGAHPGRVHRSPSVSTSTVRVYLEHTTGCRRAPPGCPPSRPEVVSRNSSVRRPVSRGGSKLPGSGDGLGPLPTVGVSRDVRGRDRSTDVGVDGVDGDVGRVPRSSVELVSIDPR